jgi:ketosteroid isomerase-like protein
MHANEKFVRDFYDAMARGDGKALASAIGPSTRWIILGESELAGTYTGSDQIFDFWKVVYKKTGGGLNLTLRDVLANDERAVALVDVTGSRDGNVLQERQVVEYEINDETFASGTFIYERPWVYDAFWN